MVCLLQTQDVWKQEIVRIESSKEPELEPSNSGVSDITAYPPSPIADDPSALPSPNPTPSFSWYSSWQFTWSQPSYASYRTVLLYFPRYDTERLKMLPLFLFAFYVLFV